MPSATVVELSTRYLRAITQPVPSSRFSVGGCLPSSPSATPARAKSLESLPILTLGELSNSRPLPARPREGSVEGEYGAVGGNAHCECPLGAACVAEGLGADSLAMRAC